MKRFDATVAWQRAIFPAAVSSYGFAADRYHQAHARCYTADSLRAGVVVEGCD